MGVDYTANTVIGLRFYRSDLIEERTIVLDNCKCPENSGKTKHCPDCGARNNVKKTRTVLKKAFEVALKDNYDVDSQYLEAYDLNLLGYKVFHASGYSDDPEPGVFYLCAMKHSVSEDSPTDEDHLDLDELTELKQKMKEKTEAVGLWRDSGFGIYTFLCC